MTLKFTNEQIFFVLESIWHKLNYKFKTHINTLVLLDGREDTEQDVTIDVETLMECYGAISQGTYGVVTDLAEILLSSLKTQLFTSSNYVDYKTYEDLVDKTGVTEVIANEYTLAILEIEKAKAKDLDNAELMIINGRAKIESGK